MHDPRRHRALARIAAIRDAEQIAARQELRLAAEREGEAAEAQDRAAAQADAAAAEWEAQLGESFHPELAQALASALMDRIGERRDAGAHAQEMTAEREGREEEWRLGDARCRQADGALRTSRRERARDREERALGRIADRASFDWRRA